MAPIHRWCFNVTHDAFLEAECSDCAHNNIQQSRFYSVIAVRRICRFNIIHACSSEENLQIVSWDDVHTHAASTHLHTRSEEKMSLLLDRDAAR